MPAPATARLSVTPVNDRPLARDDSYVTSEDEGKVRAPGILRNDSDPEREKLAASMVSRPRHGKLKADDSFVYRSRADYNGRDSFTYRASDGEGGADVARVTLRVRPVADSNGDGSAGGSSGGAGADSGAGGGSAAG